MKTSKTFEADPDAILFLVSRLQERAFRFIVAELKNLGIEGVEPSHGAILRQLSVYGPLPMGRLADLIDRTRPTVTALVNKLERHGYVKRMADPDDSRVVKVRLTDRAVALAEEFEQVSEMMREKVFKGFSLAERHILVEYLERTIKNFRDE
jgi:MarR family transcriptional regulator, organic hydroperoxide resistance regulator